MRLGIELTENLSSVFTEYLRQWRLFAAGMALGLPWGAPVSGLVTFTGGYAKLIVFGLIAAAIIDSFGCTYHAGYASAVSQRSVKYEEREAEIAKATAAGIPPPGAGQRTGQGD